MAAVPIDLGMRRREMVKKTSEQMPDISCVTGYAKFVKPHYRRIGLSSKAREFLDVLETETFGWAGRSHKQGRDEYSCVFDLCSWARELEWAKPNILRMRDELVARQVIFFEVTEPGRGIITWNLNLDEWRDAGWGGKRDGSGRPKNNQVDKASLNGSDDYQLEKNESNLSRQSATSEIKLIKPDSLEVAQDADSEQPLIKVTGKRVNDLPDANASVGVTADSPDSPQEKIIPLSEDDAVYKLACYLFDAVRRIDPKRTMPTHRTLKGLATWIDPPRGKGLRDLLAERGETEREDIKRVIDWLALPTTASFYQSRFLNHKNNPGKVLCDRFSEMSNASKPRERGATNGQHATQRSTDHRRNPTVTQKQRDDEAAELLANLGEFA